ncbi:hypothetical protein OZN62_01130 [Aurantiacibacter sp. MUD11]|uniref:hypothetical protein n=1 Tax=Aurantiacibacter sp. MUD11 TaxID=3003265 RepID=UPI0022AA1D36|nr:hypothetical protein [Aurantiacibacter sp. MUD11]WAT18210.1 hypothetical protein OZN62_01130 [Aurantiacibacter sp. MUD11]
MEGERTARAMARIEAASARIEAAVRQRAASAVSATPASDPELQRRFDHLQQEARVALEQIDQLIEELEG